MPIYEYQCSKCGEKEEHWQSMTERRKRKCSACGDTGLERVISASHVIFKGEGFYCNDYPKTN
jgi:putative FmdB family regulatory protein